MIKIENEVTKRILLIQTQKGLKLILWSA